MKKVAAFALGGIPLFTALASAPLVLADPPRPLWDCSGVMARIAGPAAATIGSQVRYEIQIYNEGTCDLSKAQITDYIPRDTIFRSATPSPSVVQSMVPSPLASIPQILWQNVHLAPNGSANEFEAIVQVSGTASRTMTNTVCVEHPSVGRICQALDTYVSQ